MDVRTKLHYTTDDNYFHITHRKLISLIIYGIAIRYLNFYMHCICIQNVVSRTKQCFSHSFLIKQPTNAEEGKKNLFLKEMPCTRS